MNKRTFQILIVALLAAVLVTAICLFQAAKARRAQLQTSFTPIELRCDGLKDPMGVDFRQPFFTWALPTQGRGREQSAYEIMVAASGENLAHDVGDLWESGKVLSSQSVGVSYSGKPLASGATYYWKVRVWDENGTRSDWSGPAFWAMGLLKATDWRGKWIGLDEETGTNESRRLPARWLRKEFTLPNEGIARATVYFSGLGWSELYLNGERVGDDVLSPPLSEYPKRVYYETYETGWLLKPGSNAIGTVLGNGRYFAPRLRTPAPTVDYDYPKLRLQLHVEFSDGTATDIVSDASWRLTTNGPIVANNEYDGEEYDARKELPGWSRPGYDDANWQPVEVVAAPGGELCGMRQHPTRVTQEIKPVSMKELRPGVYIFDLGQNMVGWCKIKVHGPAGAQITLRHAETLNPDGSLYTNNLRSAKATDIYILKGEGEEIWQPRFTLHGFRYVEATCSAAISNAGSITLTTASPAKPALDSLTGCVVGDDLPVIGDFECSDPLLNKIYHNVVWGVRGNYRSIPTDCPQRDERQGWLGDRAEESRGESYFFDNDALYSKWLEDMADCQRADGSIPSVCPAYWRVYVDDVTWAGANVVIPGMLRDQFGDERTIAEHYDCAKKWMEHMEGFITNGIIARDTYGDWCMPPEDPKLIHSQDPKRITHAALLATPFFYNDLRLMQSYARQLGRTNDAAHYAKLADKMKAAFNKQFLDRATGEYDNGTPTSSVLPLAFGMTPKDMRKKVFDFLVHKLTTDWQSHIGVGLVGGKYLLRVLSEDGRPDLAYTFATQTSYPSWGYMVEHGATTIWELWNGDTADPSMNSGNHVMLIGDLGIWLYENLAGIKPDPAQPGFKHIIMRPTPVGDLKFVNASHRCPYGWIKSEWQKDRNEFDWQVTVPPNTTATLFFPTSNVAGITESGVPLTEAAGVKLVDAENGRVVVNVEPGSYDFICETP